MVLEEPAIGLLCDPGVLKGVKCGSILPLLGDGLESGPVFL